MQTRFPNLIIAILLVSGSLMAQQEADTSYKPGIKDPVYRTGEGPVVFIDEGHHNFHTKTGRYQAFARLLERDGYRVEPYSGEFTAEHLNQGKILVISNALNKINVENWYLPNPSAFSEKEIEVVRDWVAGGGSLFLIADHMPMGGAAKDLAAAFGFSFYNGFALDTLNRGPSIFTRSSNTLTDNTITNGIEKGEKVSQVATFTGQAFTIPEEAIAILVFDEKHTIFMPDTAWQFTAETPRLSVKGWSQGAFREFEKGKVVAFGEAAMFSAQIAGPDKIKFGMSMEPARENYQLLLNIIHWLDGKY